MLGEGTRNPSPAVTQKERFTLLSPLRCLTCSCRSRPTSHSPIAIFRLCSRSSEGSGILIALQINNRNQQAQDQRKEKEYLTDIKKDLLADTMNLNVALAEVGKNLDAVITLQSHRLSI